MNPDMRARQVAQAMYERDQASQSLGMQITHIAAGQATLVMPVREDMMNGHGLVHGGFIFSLADSAFAFACNSYNQTTVAQQNQITYLSPVRAGEVLEAEAIEISRAARSGTYDVTVRTANDRRMVALMRGLARSIRGQTIPDIQEEEAQ